MANDSGAAPWTGSVGLLLSLAFHAATFVALGSFRLEPPELREPPVEFTVVDTPPPAPEPELPPPEPEQTPEPPPPQPEPVKPVVRARERAPKPVDKPPEPQPQAEPPAPADETIADFSGTTLTGEGQGGWVTAVGSGAPMNGPIGRPGALVTGRNRVGVEGGAVGGTGERLLGEADLSRKPKLPSQDLLNRALERHYPKSARQQGIEGSARIKMRVLANGKLVPTRKDNETYPGFGEACLQAMREVALEHRAEPPLDRQGQPAATEITFNCTFTVD